MSRFRVANLVAQSRRVPKAYYIISAMPARRLIYFIACFSLILSTQPAVPRSLSKYEKNKTHLTRGVPGPNLPNLDKVRRMSPAVPKMASLVSSASASRIGSLAPTKPPLQEDNWPMAILDPVNRAGASGEDLLSRNYNWTLPIVGLPGRAGLDLNLGLSLNSLIWTKSGGNIHFDMDNGFPSPGFHLSFPELKTYFYNSEAGVASQLVIMPSGERCEFWENKALEDGNSYVYEERNGSNMIIVEIPGLFDLNDTVWSLLLPDGTVYNYVVVGNDPKCVQIVDRNGNFISVAYNATTEKITTITDTLGRVVNFNYDGANRLTSVTQNWGGGTHTWATFAYSTVTISTGFLSLNMVEVQNGQTIPVLSQVGLADGCVYSFEYNTYGQVHTIHKYAPSKATPESFPKDYTQLSYVSYDLPRDGTGQQNDCPRFFTRTDWADDWNNNIGANTTFDGDLSSWGSVTTPDGVLHKEFFGAGGSWQRGLTVRTEDWDKGAQKKYSTYSWTNDDPSVSYPLRPKLIETNIYDDSGNQRRATLAYADFGSVSDVIEYDAPPNTTKVLRQTHFEYLRGTAYTGTLSRRLTQLVTLQTVSDGGGALYSKVTYEYDLGGEYQSDQGEPINHDATKFGASFVQGRGNLNRVRRWDVSDPNNAGKSVASTTGYNTAGSVIFSRDPLSHQTSVSYTDSFSDSVDRNTLAYPTTVTDADNYSSTAEYNYDFGAVTQTQDPKGASIATTYDSIGRIERVTNQVNEAYTRYVYAPNHLYVQSYMTVNDLSSEFYQITVFDGKGRTRGEASIHPGSEGGYKARSYEYDVMGRLVQQSNPTEIDVDWNPAGDDKAGWVWSSQAYDWKGRPTISTNQDGTTTTISYEGCGCAGGQSVTVTDGAGRRQREIYDVLGRVLKKQILNWDGTVYATTSNTYNTRDQVTRVREFKGAGPGDDSCPTGLCQETLMSYDGHGRLSFRKRPEEGASGTTYSYYNDDLMQTSTDARGASALFKYNARHLTTNITYTTPNPTDIPNSPNVSFQYDENGNRTMMSDGSGTVNYVYDSLSQLTSETRYFSDLASHNFVDSASGQPIPSNYQIGYSYNLIGQPKQITTHIGDTIDYAYDATGKVIKVSGTPRDRVTDYVSAVSYRAWGSEKNFTFGYQNSSISLSYNGRLQVSQINDQDKLAATFTYGNDGKINTVQGLNDRRLDRSFSYDHVGRVIGTRTASEAGLGSTEPVQFYQDYGYDEFSHMSMRQGKYWYTSNNTFSAAYTNNLASNVLDNGSAKNWQYDSEGNVISDGDVGNYFDAVGRKVKTGVNPSTTFYYDGDGHLTSQTYIDPFGLPAAKAKLTYFLWSSVLKENLAQIQLIGQDDNPGQKMYVTLDIFVYVNGKQVARRYFDGGVTQVGVSQVYWIHRDPLNTIAKTATDFGSGPMTDVFSVDPLGVEVKAAYQNEIDAYWTPAPDPVNPPQGFYQDSGGLPGTYNYGVPNPGNWGLGCYVDNIQVSCENAFRTINSGSAWGVTLSLNGPVGPSAAPIVAGIEAAATSIDGQSTSRMRIVQQTIPGDPNGLTIEDEFGGVIDESAPVHSITGYAAVYDSVEVGLQIQPSPTPTWTQKNNIPVVSYLVDGFRNAAHILGGGDKVAKSCKDAIASKSNPDPIAILISLYGNGPAYHPDELNSDTNPNVPASTVGIGRGAKVTFWASYFTRFEGSEIIVDGKLVRLTAYQTRALIWLHELSHATGKYTHDNDSLHEIGNISENDLNAILYKNCIKGANLLPQPPPPKNCKLCK